MDKKREYSLFNVITQTPDVIEYCASNDINILLAYDNSSGTQIDRLCQITNKRVKVFIDCGAFSLDQKGHKVNEDRYIEILNRNMDNIYCYACIDATAYTVRDIDTAKVTYENFERMYYKMKDPEKMVFCIHPGEKFEEPDSWFRKALRWKSKDGKPITRFACGLVVHKSLRLSLLNSIYKVIKEENREDIMFHALGVTDFGIVRDHSFITTSDSSSAIQTMISGSVRYKGKDIKVQNDRRHSKGIVNQEEREAVLKELEELYAKTGIDFSCIKTSTTELFKLNVLLKNLEAKEKVFSDSNSGGGEAHKMRRLIV